MSQQAWAQMVADRWPRRGAIGKGRDYLITALTRHGKSKVVERTTKFLTLYSNYPFDQFAIGLTRFATEVVGMDEYSWNRWYFNLEERLSGQSIPDEDLPWDDIMERVFQLRVDALSEWSECALKRCLSDLLANAWNNRTIRTLGTWHRKVSNRNQQLCDSFQEGHESEDEIGRDLSVLYVVRKAALDYIYDIVDEARVAGCGKLAPDSEAAV